MKRPDLSVKVKHSEKNNAWNIVGDMPGNKYKIARIPYLFIEDNDILTTRNKAEALEHAMFICFCFNNPDRIRL